MADVSIQDIRTKYPQYSDMSDQQLADALHKKYYSDMPVDTFYKKIGYSAEKPSLGSKIKNVAAEGMNALTAMPEAAASMATQTLAPVAASVQNLVEGKTTPQDYSEAKKEWTYTPTNPQAQSDLKAVGEIPGLKQIGELTDKVSDFVAKKTGGKVSKEEITDAINTALLAVGGKEGTAEGTIASSIKPKAVVATEDTTREAAAAQDLAAGHGGVRKPGVISDTQREIQKLARSDPDLNIPITKPLNDETIDKIVDRAGDAYNKVENVKKPNINMSPGNSTREALMSKLQEINKEYSSGANHAPDAIDKVIKRITEYSPVAKPAKGSTRLYSDDGATWTTNKGKQFIDVPTNKLKNYGSGGTYKLPLKMSVDAKSAQFSTRDIIEETKKLGKAAKSARRTGDDTLAYAYTQIRSALDETLINHLKRNGEDPQLIANLQKARTTIAKAETLRKAITGNGLIDPTKLKGFLTGNLAEVQRLGKTYHEYGKGALEPKEQGKVKRVLARLAGIAGGTAGAELGVHLGHHPVTGYAVGREVGESAANAAMKPRGKPKTLSEKIDDARKAANKKKKAVQIAAPVTAVSVAQSGEDQQSD